MKEEAYILTKYGEPRYISLFREDLEEIIRNTTSEDLKIEKIEYEVKHD